MAGKGPRIKIMLKSTESAYFYTVYINPRNRKMKGHQGKFEIMKFDPFINKHVLFKEEKIKS